MPTVEEWLSRYQTAAALLARPFIEVEQEYHRVLKPLHMTEQQFDRRYTEAEKRRISVLGWELYEKQTASAVTKKHGIYP